MPASKLLSKKVQEDILAPIILHREREDISKEHFHHLTAAVMKCSDPNNQCDLITRVLQIVAMDVLPDNEKPSGAPR